MGRLTRFVGGLAALALGVSGCGADPEIPAAVDAPAEAASSAPVSSPLDGDWVSHLSPEQLTKNLADAGQEKWADDFLAAERITDDLTAVYTFDGNSFRVAYLNTDGSWQVGWWGALDVGETTVDLYDDYYQITDTFAWSIDGNQLSLTWESSDAKRLKGIPVEVFHDAYLSDPLVRANCALDFDEPC